MFKFHKLPQEKTPVEKVDPPVIPLMSLKDEFRLTQAPVQVEQWQNILSEIDFNKQILQADLRQVETHYQAIEKGEDDLTMDENLIQVLKHEIIATGNRVEIECQLGEQLEKKLSDIKHQLLFVKKFIFDQQQALTRYDQKHFIISEQTNEMLILKKNLQYEIYRGSNIIQREGNFFATNLATIKDQSSHLKEQINSDIRIFQQIRHLSQLQKQVLHEQKAEISELEFIRERKIEKRKGSDDIIDQIQCLKNLITIFVRRDTEAEMALKIPTEEKEGSATPNSFRGRSPLKTASMVKNDFYRRMRRSQSQIMEPLKTSAFEKDRHIDAFYQFCGSQLIPFLHEILAVYHTQKLNESNLSEQFDNFNRQKHLMNHLLTMLDQEIQSAEQRHEKNQFLEKHCLAQDLIDSEMVRPYTLIENNDRVYRQYRDKVEQHETVIFRHFLWLNQHCKRWSMMMIEINQLSTNPINQAVTIDNVDPNSPFQLRFKAFFDRCLENTLWVKEPTGTEFPMVEQLQQYLEQFYLKLNLNSRRNPLLAPLNENMSSKIASYLRGDYFFYNFVTVEEIKDRLNKFAGQLKQVLDYDEAMSEQQLSYIYQEFDAYVIGLLGELKIQTSARMLVVFKEQLLMMQELLQAIQTLIKELPQIQEQPIRKAVRRNTNKGLSKFHATQKEFFGANRIFQKLKQPLQRQIVAQKCREYEQYYNPRKTYEQKLKLLPLIHTSIVTIKEGQQGHLTEQEEQEHMTQGWLSVRTGRPMEMTRKANTDKHKHYMSMSLRKQKLEQEMREFTQMQKTLENTLKLVPAVLPQQQTHSQSVVDQKINFFTKKFSIKLEKKSTESLLQKIRETYTTMNTIKSSFKMKSIGSGYGLKNTKRNTNRILSLDEMPQSVPTTRAPSIHI